jgi:hypothetical protein
MRVRRNLTQWAWRRLDVSSHDDDRVVVGEGRTTRERVI